MTFTWWLVPNVVLGVLLILAPVIGRMYADVDQPSHCPACGRELIGDPPAHRLADRANCAAVLAYQSEERARRRGWRPW